ncbi:MAG: hypothetical protein AABZ74_11460 [Cyanobacteriota bacterium]
MSKILNEKQIQSVRKLGDIMIPQSSEFPSFSQLGCIEYIDNILEYTDKQDQEDLKTLLTALSLMPDNILEKIVNFIASPDVLPEALAKTARLVDTALRGIIFALYYSGHKGENYVGKNPLEIIGYEINRV